MRIFVQSSNISEIYRIHVKWICIIIVGNDSLSQVPVFFLIMVI